MAALPLIRARYALSFAETLESVGVSPFPVLEHARVPERAIERPDALIPVARLCTLVGLAARAADRRDLGWRAAEGMLERIAAFATHTLAAPTLRLALDDFCRQALSEYTKPVFWIEEREREVLLCRGPFEG